MIQSNNNNHIVYVLPGELVEKVTMTGGWYFIDEAEELGGGPYTTEREATEKLNQYVSQLYDYVSRQ